MVNVNAEDIAWANKQDRWACAIVRAIQREIPTATFVRADTETIAYSDGGHRYTYSTPMEAIENVIKPLDTGKKIQPFSFDLGAPTVKEVRKMTPELKKQMREHERNRTTKEKKEKKETGNTRTHNRFCPESYE